MILRSLPALRTFAKIYTYQHIDRTLGLCLVNHTHAHNQQLAKQRQRLEAQQEVLLVDHALGTGRKVECAFMR